MFTLAEGGEWLRRARVTPSPDAGLGLLSDLQRAHLLFVADGSGADLATVEPGALASHMHNLHLGQVGRMRSKPTCLRRHAPVSRSSAVKCCLHASQPLYSGTATCWTPPQLRLLTHVHDTGLRLVCIPIEQAWARRRRQALCCSWWKTHRMRPGASA